MPAANQLNNQQSLNFEDGCKFSNEQKELLKKQISMLQQQSESLKKEEEELEEKKQNILAVAAPAKNGDVEAMDQQEEYSGGEEKEQLSPERLVPHSSIEEYEENAAEVDDEDLDPPSDEDDEEQQQYLSVDKDTFIKMAKERIRKLEEEIHRLRSNARDDDLYIKELEENIAYRRSPQRRIKFLENQIENGRHQYANLSAEFRHREESIREKTEAFESMKAKMLQQLMHWGNVQKELNAKLETKDKEIEQLRQALAAASQNPEIATSPSTLQTATSSQPLKSPLTIYQPSTSPSNTETTITDESMDSTNPKTPESNPVGIVKSTKSNESSPDLCY